MNQRLDLRSIWIWIGYDASFPSPSGPTDITFSEEFQAKLQKWDEADSALIPGLMCCGFCGATAFGGQTPSAAGFSTVPASPGLPLPPHAFCNGPMQRHMIVEGKAGQPAEWRACGACKADPTKRKKYQVQMSPQFMKAVVSSYPLDVQMTSVMDVSVNLRDRVNGYAHGDIRSDNVLLSNPLVARGQLPPERQPGEGIPEEVQSLLVQLKQSSPLVQKFKTLAEKPVPGHGLPLLPPESIQAITENAALRDPTGLGFMADNIMDKVFSMVAAVDANPDTSQPSVPPTGFRVGSVTYRDSGQDVDVLTDCCGLPIKAQPAGWRAGDGDSCSGDDDEEPDAGVLQLTVELAVFAALFPHARGAFAAGRFNDYLRYRMSCAFSPFTLYKPYLMVMFLLRQCNLLHGQCGEEVLERDMRAYRKANPSKPEEESVRHAMKHVVPNTIPGTPGWHYKALQDLLTMVEANGLPHLFWTVTMDEVGEIGEGGSDAPSCSAESQVCIC